ncbi:MAG TPA: efflux RND transporter permease subunit [Acidobacteriota bacterium]|nr:efflux RND transporter permease subunit [Acidobacteriota bacterium]
MADQHETSRETGAEDVGREDKGRDETGRGEVGTWISSFSIRYPVTVCMLLISFLLMGAVSLTKIPLVLLPSINAPFVVVVAPYPNATPEQVQEEITRPLEEVLATLPNVKRLTSRSSADQAEVVMEFGLGEDIDVMRAEVREKVDQIRDELPGDLRDVLVLNFNTNDIPIIEGRIASGRDLRGQYELLDVKIKRPLERIPGVGEVNIDGVARQRIDIDLRLDDIKKYGVDIGSVFNKLDGTNFNVSLGRVEDGGVRYGVISDGSVSSLDELRNFPVNERGLLLEDIADIDLVNPGTSYGRHLNGEFAIGLAIRKASDANTVETVRRIQEAIEEINRDPALQGIEVLVWHDAGAEITESLQGLLNAGTLGAVLAVFVLFIFLRKLGATIAIGLCIPFSIVSAVGFLYLLGSSLNVLSMMGLMLSTGMLVDNAVVVLESIYSNLEKGMQRVKASITGTQGVVRAVVASTLTSIIIFVPLVFGRETIFTLFLSHAGIAIMITLLCSLFVSMTLIPLGLARFFRLRLSSASSSQEKAVRRGWINAVRDRYADFLRWTLRHPVWTVVAILVILISTGFPQSQLKDSSVDAIDMQDLMVEYEFSENYHYEKIESDYVEPVEAFLMANRDKFGIENVYSWYANNAANTRIFFDEDKVAQDEVENLREAIGEGLPVIPGADIRLGQQEGAENRQFLSVSVYGENGRRLRELVMDAKRRLELKEEFAEIYTGVDESRQEVQLVLDRTKAREFGVSPESVAGILSIVIRGRQLRSFRSEQGEVEVWVSLQPTDREDLEDLLSIVVGGGPQGEEIRLAQIADLTIVKTPGSIRRENRRTFANMWINYTGGDTEAGKASIRETLESITFPEGYSWSFGFQTIEQENQELEFLFNFLLALFMVYLVMASLFESFAHPFAIMLSLLFAWPGVTWFLYLTGTPFNLMAMLGALILIGIVVNNGIVLIDHVNTRRREGLPRSEAIVEGCRERFRPILMTAATTIVGMIPLALGTTGVFGLRYFPMARTVIGGLAASTVLSLVVLPTAYWLVDELALWTRQAWFAARSKAAPQPVEGAPAAPGTPAAAS